MSGEPSHSPTGGHARRSVALVGAAALLVMLPPGLNVWTAVVLIGAVGVPHGASDTALFLPPFVQRHGRLGVPAFFGLYLGLAGAMMAFWMVTPVAALALFLFLSAWHFGTDDAQGRWSGDPVMRRTEMLIRGVLPIAAPALFYEAEVARIFAALVPPAEEAAATAMANGLSLLAPFAIAGAFISGMTLLLSKEKAAGHSLLATLCLTAGFPPLIGFSLYFAFVHSARQVKQRMHELSVPSLGAYLRVSGPYIAGGMIVMILTGFFSPMMEDAVLRGLFIGLAAVTVPHILFERPWSRDPARTPPQAAAAEANPCRGAYAQY